MNIEPLGDRVLVEIIVEEDKPINGLIIPNKNKINRYQIYALSDDLMLKGTSFKIGDFVMIEKYSGAEIIEDDKKYLILSSNEIIAKIRHS